MDKDEHAITLFRLIQEVCEECCLYSSHRRKKKKRNLYNNYYLNDHIQQNATKFWACKNSLMILYHCTGSIFATIV